MVAVYIIFSVYITTLSIKATRKIPENTPIELGMVYRDINFQTSDGINLEGWYVDNKKNELVILIHGVDSNKSDGKMLVALLVLASVCFHHIFLVSFFRD